MAIIMKNENCAGCKNDTVEIKPSEVMDGFYAECTNCGCTGCSCSTIEIAVENWNELQLELKR